MKFIRSVILSVFLPSLVIAQAQFSYKPGFIVNNTGDTVKGFVKEDEEKNFMRGVSFASAVSGDQQKFMTTTDIKGFGFTDGAVYEKTHYADAGGGSFDVFAYYVVAGYYRLFSFLVNDRQYFAIKNQKDSTFLLYDDETTVTGVVETQGNYKNQLLFFARDCESLKAELNNLAFAKSDIISFVNSLNRCVSPSAMTQVLYKKPPGYFRYYAYVAGITLGSNKYDVTGRVMVRYVIPGIDTKSSLNFGINYMKHSETFTELNAGNEQVPGLTVTDIVSVPLNIQYNFLKGVVQPYVSGGVSLDLETIEGGVDYVTGPYPSSTKFGIGITGSLGVECPITKNFMVKADWTYELIAHYPVLGISYFFK